jgi:hypothetical protein
LRNSMGNARPPIYHRSTPHSTHLPFRWSAPRCDTIEGNGRNVRTAGALRP